MGPILALDQKGLGVFDLYLDCLFSGFASMVNVFYESHLTVEFHGKGGYISNGVYIRDACFEESISLQSKKDQ